MTVERKEIGYVLVLVDDRDTRALQETIATIIDIAEQEAMVEVITASFIVILVGVPIPQPRAFEIKQSIIERLVQEVGSKVSIVHGNTICPVGIVGTDRRKTYTALIPNYRELMKCLVAVPIGSVQQKDA